MDKKTRELVETISMLLFRKKDELLKSEKEALTHLITIVEKYEELKVTNCDLKAKANKYDKVVEGLEEALKECITKMDSVAFGMTAYNGWEKNLAKAIKSKLIGEWE